MPSKVRLQRFADIVEHVDLIREFLSGVSFEQFKADKKLNYAVVRALEIISEASRRLPDEFKAKHPGIPWKQVAASGNVYRHDYGGVNLALVWDTAKHHLDDLRTAAAAELDQLRQNGA